MLLKVSDSYKFDALWLVRLFGYRSVAVDLPCLFYTRASHEIESQAGTNLFLWCRRTCSGPTCVLVAHQNAPCMWFKANVGCELNIGFVPF